MFDSSPNLPKFLNIMANQVIRHGLMMRKHFLFGQQDVVNWFPGHMARGLKDMQKKLKDVDCIIEVHDARIPLSGRNPFFHSALGLSVMKPHILVMNKMDLADMRFQNNIYKHYKKEGVNEVIFANCKHPDSKGVKSIIPTIAEVLIGVERYNRAEIHDFTLMVIGVPNAGKSTLINALRAKNLRRGKGTKVGAQPGVTRSVLEKVKVCNRPLMYLVDTPGVLTPRIPDVETGLKLALVDNIKNQLLGEDVIADYLLFRLNEQGNTKYVPYLDLDEPCDDIRHVLSIAAARNNWIRKVRLPHIGMQEVPDHTKAALYFLQGFRKGEYGRITLDHFEKAK
ncbi:mitochondrial ribosome-associated GTPase 1 isoform X2 [Oratosquilla oratoria]|uniref:mitochondrial ribosome-associated GTPase 1 isoform X2 n=1 Tax=Oratosquilla oratoria TaxID=337810 RepID=UPI003F775256